MAVAMAEEKGGGMGGEEGGFGTEARRVWETEGVRGCFFPEMISVCVCGRGGGASLPCWLVMFFIGHPAVVGKKNVIFVYMEQDFTEGRWPGRSSTRRWSAFFSSSTNSSRLRWTWSGCFLAEACSLKQCIKLVLPAVSRGRPQP